MARVKKAAKNAVQKNGDNGAIEPLALEDFAGCFDERFPMSSFLRNHGTSARGSNAISELRKIVVEGNLDNVATDAQMLAFFDGTVGSTCYGEDTHQELFWSLMMSCYTADDRYLRKSLTRAKSKRDRVCRAVALGRLLLELDTPHSINQSISPNSFWGDVSHLQPSRPGDIVYFLMHAYVHADPANFHARAQRAFNLSLYDPFTRSLEQHILDMRTLDTEEAWQKTHATLRDVVFPCLYEVLERNQIQLELKTYYEAALKVLSIDDIRKTYSDLSHYMRHNDSLFRSTLMDVGLTDTIEY